MDKEIIEAAEGIREEIAEWEVLRSQTGEWSCNHSQIFSFCAGTYF
jgi:hypothetical protein